MSRTILIVALVAALIGGVATYTIQAATQTAESEVRISAQRLDDGRVEFALQQRQPDGAWGERLLPQRRFFPASGFVNHWANSSPLTITSQIEGPPGLHQRHAAISHARRGGIPRVLLGPRKAKAAAGSSCLAASKAARILATWGLIFTGVDSDITTIEVD